VHFVIAHNAFGWKIPFDHRLVAVGELTLPGAVQASQFLDPALAFDHGLGGSRATPAIHELIKTSVDGEESIAVSSYRMFLSTEVNDSGFTSIPFEDRFRIITPDFFLEHHGDLVLHSIPKDLDLVIARPINFSVSVLEQYTAHHLADLLKGVSLAIEMKLIDQGYAAQMLSRPILLPFGFFLSRATLRMHIHQLFWDFILQYYLMFGRNLQRQDYQKRYIDFVAERIFSIFLFEYIIKNQLRFRTSRPILVSATGSHVASR
jgi:hypothetical protein